MSMRPCDKCLNNDWEFKMLDNKWIEATCNYCGFDVQFPSKQNKKKHNIDTCKDCNVKLYVQPCDMSPKKLTKKLKKPYYYTAMLKCPKCKKTYMSEKFKILNK